MLPEFSGSPLTSSALIFFMRSTFFSPAFSGIAAAALPLCSVIPASAAFPQLKLEVVCDRQIDSPVVMTHAGDGSGRMFIADQRGKIRIFRNGMLQPGVFLDIGAKLVPERSNFDERGLLGLAFHPDYANPVSPGFRRFYVFYSAPSPNAPGTPSDPVDCRSTVAEFQVSPSDPDVADPASERILLSFDKPQFNHNGGGLEFGPDGFLYFTAGDGGSSNDNNFGHTGGGGAPRPTNAKGNAQDLTNRLGKIHRIDPLGTDGPGGTYGIPASNPFATSPNGERPEIFAFGLRNCWRFSFDSRPGGTNRLFGADVGQGQVEEINLLVSGANYGWRNREGSFVPNFSIDAPPLVGTVVDPIVQYAHPGIEIGLPPLPQYGISVTGGYVYRGSAIPGLVGKYVFADWSQSFTSASGRMLGMEETAPNVWSLSNLDVLGGNPLSYFVQAFGQDEAGELYVLAKSAPGVTNPDPVTGLPSGVIMKIVPVPATTAVTLNAARDNTIFQEAELSNGAGSWIFAGATDPSKNGGALRRALLAWNLGSIPPGSVVSTAAVTLKMDRTIAPAYAFSLHKLVTDWGEGTANAAVQEGDGASPSANDATWLKPFFGQAGVWSEPGGDFSSEKSATVSVAAETNYLWASPGLAADANAWLAAPSSNFGWILKADIESVATTGTGTAGQFTITVANVDGLVDGMNVQGFGIGNNAEIASAGVDIGTNVVTLTAANVGAVSGTLIFGAPSAKRFASRTATVSASRPKLALTYVPPPPPPSHRKAWELASYFIGQFIDDHFDTDGDGIVDGIEYAWGFAPRIPDENSAGFSVDDSGLAQGNPVIITFRRDPLATDLVYRAQVTSDLVDWTTLATSAAGAAPTGPGFVSEAVADSPFRTVTVQDDVPQGTGRRFYRLQVTRM